MLQVRCPFAAVARGVVIGRSDVASVAVVGENDFDGGASFDCDGVDLLSQDAVEALSQIG